MVASKKKDGSKEEIVKTFQPRTVQPLCGQINQDIEGTAQGTWFWENKGKYEMGVIESSTLDLTLAHDNVEPTIGRMVVGGTFTSPGVLLFTPQHEGTINREFSEVVADGQTYCYDNRDEIPVYPWLSGKVVLQLVDDHRLLIEQQGGLCEQDESFHSSYTYKR